MLKHGYRQLANGPNRQARQVPIIHQRLLHQPTNAVCHAALGQHPTKFMAASHKSAAQHTCIGRCMQYVKHNEIIVAAEEKREKNNNARMEIKTHDHFY
jgi:hypothetical protein